MPGQARWRWRIIVLLGAAAIVAGLWGWHRQAPDAGLLEILYWTLQMFALEGGERAATNVWAQLARVLAPIATAGALIQFGAELFARASERYGRWRISRARGHTLICDLGERGRAFALRELARPVPGQKRPIIVVAAAPSEADASFCAVHDLPLLRGDAAERQVLRGAALAKAHSLLITGNDDARNLAVAMTARDVLAEAPLRAQPVRVFVSIEDRQLWSELTRSDSVQRRSRNFQLVAFHLSDLVARRFFWRRPLYRYAGLRDQPRIHAVFLGFGEYGQALLAQMLLACGYRDLAAPVISVLSPEARTEESRLLMNYPHIGKLAVLHIEEFDAGSQALDDDRLAEIEARSPVTAVFVCVPGDESALRAAIYVREAMQRSGRWQAPVYVRMRRGEGAADLLCGSGEARRFGDVLEVFGTELEHCNLDIIDDGPEKIARAIHDAYRNSRRARVEDERGVQRQEALAEWEELRETYRLANRRAADHVRAKLESAGYHVPADFAAGGALISATALRVERESLLGEALAALEHRAWMIGLQLDGWQPARIRDNRRRRHDKLIDYEDLDESVRDYDRDQIDLIFEQFRRPSGDPDAAVRSDHWVGLIGRNRVSVAQAEWARAALCDKVLPGLVARHSDAHLTLVTPLAPGLDLILTRAALDWLAGCGIAHRLLVVEGVPEAAMLDDYRDAYEQGAAWDGEPRRDEEPWQNGADPERSGRAKIAAARAAVLARPACEWAIDLSSAELDYTDENNRREGYRRAADYIAARAHTLVAATLADAPVRPGGVGETLQRRPPLLAERRRRWPDPQRCTTIRLEIDSERIDVSDLDTPASGTVTN